jgi:zinc protease
MLRSFVFLLASAALASAADGPRRILPFPYTQEDLANGLRIVTVSTDSPNVVSLFIVVQTGSRNEVEPGHTGFAHLFEHLMFKGTPKYSATQYDQTLRRIGAINNATTTEDFTLYYTTFSKEDLETMLAMEADRFQNLKVAEPEFKTESLAVLGEYNKNSSSPFEKLNEVLSETAFDHHTYRHTTMGFLKDIQDMPNQYDYSLKFFDRYYRPEYTTILVVGDAKPKPVHDLVVKYWGNWKRGDYKADIPTEPPQTEPRTGHVEWPSPTLPIVVVGYKGPAYSDTTKETAALDALAILAFSQTSDLYQKLVVREQKVDSVAASPPDQVDPSLFAVMARVKNPADMAYVQDQILATINQLREKPVDAARLEAVRSFLRNRAALRMGSSDSIAQSLVPFIARRRTPDSMNKLFDQYAALTPEDIQQVAAKYLVDSGRTTITLTGPEATR